VGEGDNLYALAARYFTKTGSYVTVQRLNRIADPRRLQIGSLIQIPHSLLRQEPIQAVVQSFRGTVRAGRGDASQPVRVGMVLREGDLIDTGANSFVTLLMPDESSVAIPSRSSVRIQRLRKTLLVDTVDRSFVIVKGRANAAVTPMTKPDSSFDLSTPVAVSAVRGTQFRMSYDPVAQRTTTEVIEGIVGFSKESGKAATHKGEGQLVQAGFGTATDLTEPVALPPAPEILRPGRVQDEEHLQFEIRPLGPAVAYHVQIAQDAGFLNLLDELETSSPRAVLLPLPNGSYFVRATVIDERGLEGMPTTYGFERRLNRVEASVEGSRAGRYRQYLFRWRTPDASNAQYRFQLVATPESEAPVVDEAGLKKTSFIVTDLPQGIYRWRVMTLQVVDGRVYEKWTPFQELRVSSEQ